MPETQDRQERIRQRAYELWLQDGEPEGKEGEHWERARLEIEGGQTEKSEDKPATPSGTTFGP